MSELPKTFKKFTDDYPDIAKGYEAMGKAVHAAGPLDEKTRALIKLAVSVGARMEGAVHSHTRKALDADCTAEEIKQTVLLSLPTTGLPNMMASMTWVNDILEK